MIFFPYLLDSYGSCVVIDTSAPRLPLDVCVHPEKGPSLFNKLKKAIEDVEEENT